MFKIKFVYSHACLWSCLSAYDCVCLSAYYPCLFLPACFLTAVALLPVQHPVRVTAGPLEKANITALVLIFAIALNLMGVSCLCCHER